MGPVDHVGERADIATIGKQGADVALEIDAGNQFALAQIVDGGSPIGRRDAEGHALAGATAVETENEAGTLFGAAMDIGPDAECTTIATEPGQHPLLIGKAGIPHQRAVAKDPKFVHIARQSNNSPDRNEE